MTVKALIVDDEPLARRAIRRHLSADTDIEVVGECDNGEEAVEAIRGGRPDLVFLDVQMPELDGIEVVQRVGVDRMPVTIFVTAYAQHAVRAFDVHALDYVLKPVSSERIAAAVRRAKRRIAGDGVSRDALRNILATLWEPRGSYPERLPVTHGGRVIFVDSADIDWVEARGNHTRLWCGTQQFEVRQTLSNMEQKLDPRSFVRIHRSTIVNVRRIKEIHRWFHGHHVVVLTTGKKLRMSRYQRDAARRLGVD